MKRMRKLAIPVLIASLLLTALAGCARTGNTLLDGASPENSALALYTCDGQTVTRQFLFDQAEEQEILNKLAKVRATPDKDWKPTQASAPIYAVEIGGKDGMERVGAWSDGHWICPDGTVYRFGFDFSTLDAYHWDTEHVDTFPRHVLPCSRAMCLGPDGWNAAMLDPAAELAPPVGIGLTLLGADGTALRVEFRNDNEAEWSFGEDFSVQAELDGVWYDIPTMPGAWGFNDIAWLLMPGQTQEKRYDLAMYGALPAGQYRLVTAQLAVPFVID